MWTKIHHSMKLSTNATTNCSINEALVNAIEGMNTTTKLEHRQNF